MPVLGAILLAVYNLYPSSVHVHTAIVLAIDVGGVAALALATRASRSTTRLVAGALTVSVAATLAGDAIWWGTALLHHDTPAASPSAADVFWLGGHPFFVLALWLLLRRGQATLDALLDSLAAAVGMALVTGIWIVGPYLTDSSQTLLGQLTQTAYAGFDIVLLSMALGLAARLRHEPAAARLVAVAALAWLFSDFAWNWTTLTAAYTPGHWADTGWDLSTVLLTAAALHPSFAALSRPIERRSGLGGWGAFVIGLVSLTMPAVYAIRDELAHWFRPAFVEPLVVTCGILLTGIVVARLWLLVRQSQRFAGELEVLADERRRRLSESEARYENLVLNLPAVTFTRVYDTTHAASPILYVSPQIEAMTGFSPEALRRDPGLWLRCIHPDDRARVAAAVVAARTASGHFKGDYRFVRPDGGVTWVQSESSPVIDDDGTPLYAQGFIVDVTDRHRAEEERARIEEELRLAQRLESVGQLAAGIAHEINTPVQFVGDSVRFLEDAFDELLALTDEYRRAAATHPGATGERLRASEESGDLAYLLDRVPAALARTFEGIDRVATIVRAMRQFAHPAGHEKVPADLNETLQTTLVMAANELKYVADVRLELAPLPPIVCDAGDVGQVFLNLLVNAAQAVAEKHGATGERGTISVTSRLEDGHAVFEVADTGTGIPESVRERIFEPFFTTKEVGHGTGQGLALARSIVVDGHGGTLSFVTELGVGTTFTMRLPVAPQRAERIAA